MKTELSKTESITILALLGGAVGGIIRLAMSGELAYLVAAIVLVCTALLYLAIIENGTSDDNDLGGLI